MRSVRVAILTCVVTMLVTGVATAGTYAPAPTSDMGGGTASTAYGPLAPGVGYGGSITAQGQVDWYSFYAQPNSRIEVTLTLDPTACGADDANGCYVYAQLVTASGGSIVRPGTSATGCSDRTDPMMVPSFDCVPAAVGAGSGRYYVQVYEDGTDVFPSPYTLTISGTGIASANPVPCERAQRAVKRDARAARRAHGAARRRAGKRLAAAQRTLRAVCGS